MIRNNKRNCMAAGLLLAMLLTGCGGTGEKTQEAMLKIQGLDYEGALEQLNSAEEAGENMRLINRARGIAYMGLTDYNHLREMLGYGTKTSRRSLPWNRRIMTG